MTMLLTEPQATPTERVASLSEFATVQSDHPLGAGPDPKSFRWCYWRREDGYIVAAPAWATEYQRATRKGMKPLDREFGEFLPRGRNEPKDPYHRILHHPQGPAAFTLEQIREHGWDVKPPYGVRFPQLEAVAAFERVRCSVCPKEFLTTEDRDRHETIAHREDTASNRLGRAIADSVQKGDVSESLAQVLAQLVENQTLMQTQLAAQQQTTNALLERLVAPAAALHLSVAAEEKATPKKA